MQAHSKDPTVWHSQNRPWLRNNHQADIEETRGSQSIRKNEAVILSPHPYRFSHEHNPLLNL